MIGGARLRLAARWRSTSYTQWSNYLFLGWAKAQLAKHKQLFSIIQRHQICLRSNQNIQNFQQRISWFSHR